MTHVYPYEYSHYNMHNINKFWKRRYIFYTRIKIYVFIFKNSRALLTYSVNFKRARKVQINFTIIYYVPTSLDLWISLNEIRVARTPMYVSKIVFIEKTFKTLKCSFIIYILYNDMRSFLRLFFILHSIPVNCFLITYTYIRVINHRCNILNFIFHTSLLHFSNL